MKKFGLIIAVVLCIGSVQQSNAQAFKTTNPEELKLITTDVENFWAMMDKLPSAKSKQDTLQVIENEYIKKATFGLKTYIEASYSNAESFYWSIVKHPKLLASLRHSTAQIAAQKPKIIAAAKQLKAILPEAIFPEYYFVIGKFEVGGSKFDNMLYIGAELTCLAEDAPLGELGAMANYATLIKNVDNIVIHETAHYQQVMEVKTNLDGAFIEGGAEFVSYQLTGKTNLKPHFKTLKKKGLKTLHEEFMQTANAPIEAKWFLANYDEVKKRPGSLGYVVGFDYCQKYYKKAKDKQQALRDIIKLDKGVNAMMQISK